MRRRCTGATASPKLIEAGGGGKYVGMSPNLFSIDTRCNIYDCIGPYS